MGTRIQSVSRSLSILDTLSLHPDGLSNKEIAAENGLNISTSHHLVKTLQEFGYVSRNDQGQYCVGSAAGRLYSAYLRGPSLHKCLKDAVNELAEVTGETAYVCVWRNQAAVIEAIVEGSKAVRVGGLSVGFMGHTHLRASGKLLLAFLGTGERDAYIDQADFTPRTSRSVQDGRALRKQLSQIESEGFAVDDGEYEDEVKCVSAPVFSAEGKVTAALTVSAPSQRFQENRGSLIEAVLGVAGRTSEILGSSKEM